MKELKNEEKPQTMLIKQWRQDWGGPSLAIYLWSTLRCFGGGEGGITMKKDDTVTHTCTMLEGHSHHCMVIMTLWGVKTSKPKADTQHLCERDG